MSSSDPTGLPFVVVDSSVSLKWALDDEEAVTEAIALRDDAIRGSFVLLAPSLWFYEVINGLITAVRRGRLATNIGSQMLGHLLNVGVQMADPEAGDVYDLAVQYRVAAYDAAYLALAQTLNAPLWTGDRQFYEIVHDTVGLVRWIGDYQQVGL